mmetsp:Transcript_32664/g.98261  ORF Transcript_32664/g.98261 Transcript_32664/m.98261 type:complete len:214 (+) Transcript_32664:641-1282(+)
MTEHGADEARHGRDGLEEDGAEHDLLLRELAYVPARRRVEAEAQQPYRRERGLVRERLRRRVRQLDVEFVRRVERVAAREVLHGALADAERMLRVRRLKVVVRVEARVVLGAELDVERVDEAVVGDGAARLGGVEHLADVCDLAVREGALVALQQRLELVGIYAAVAVLVGGHQLRLDRPNRALAEELDLVLAVGVGDRDGSGGAEAGMLVDW